MTERTIIRNAHIVTVNKADDEFSDGYLVIDDAVIVAVGSGAVPDEWTRGTPGEHAGGGVRTTIIDAGGHLVTPGLINTHHHLYQWLTRGYAQDAILFDWLTALYPLWSLIDADLVEAGALGAIAVAARSGCSTVGDHHYVFPGGAGDILGGIVNAALRPILRSRPSTRSCRPATWRSTGITTPVPAR